MASTANSTAPIVTVTRGNWRAQLGLVPGNLVKRKQPGAMKNKAQKDPSKFAPGFSRPVLFQHVDIEFRSGVTERGGGRGFFATKDIEPGELIMSEIPCAEIPDAPMDRDPAERCLLNLASGRVKLEEAQAALKDLELLHPRSLEKDVDPERLKTLSKDYARLLKEMDTLPLGKTLGLTVESTLLRAICALHFNGFVTGVYLHLAMVNHSCAPNCTKWGARDGVPHSEVRAIRRIKAGEEITFSYLVPALRSFEARQRALQGQFQFECQCDLCRMTNGADVRLEQGPPEAIQELEQLLEQVEQDNELYTEPRATLQKVSKARNAAKMKGVGPRALCLAHADIVTVDACLALLEDGNPTRPRDEQMLILTLLTRSLSVRKTQILLFTVGVPDCEDAQAIKREETRSEAEVTLQHIGNGIGYFSSLGKKGEKILTSLTDDETGVQFFIDNRDAVDCQIAADRACRAIADLYEDYDYSPE